MHALISIIGYGGKRWSDLIHVIARDTTHCFTRLGQEREKEIYKAWIGVIDVSTSPRDLFRSRGFIPRGSSRRGEGAINFNFEVRNTDRISVEGFQVADNLIVLYDSINLIPVNRILLFFCFIPSRRSFSKRDVSGLFGDRFSDHDSEVPCTGSSLGFGLGGKGFFGEING